MTSTRSLSYFPPAEGSLFHLDEFEHHTEVHQGEIGDATVVVLARTRQNGTVVL